MIVNLPPRFLSISCARAGIALFALSVAPSGGAAPWQPQLWPVLRHYDRDHLLHLALPLGGIGTGTVSLGGRGELRDWEIMNRPAKGFSTVLRGNGAPFFAVHAAKADGTAVTTRGLLGPVDHSEYHHYEGRPVDHHGVPRFAEASFDAAYPFGQANLSDPSIPLRVRVKGFNPFVPGDSARSGLPVAVLSYEITNTSAEPLIVSVAGSVRNFIGRDGSWTKRDWKGDVVPQGAKGGVNTFRDDSTAGLRGILFSSNGVKTDDPAWGTFALVTDSPADAVSHRTSSRANQWENALLDFWDDFSADGVLTEKETSADEDPMASLAVRKTIAPGATIAYNFYLTWHFPNRMAWSEFKFGHGKHRVGNYYTTLYQDAWDAAAKIVPKVPALETATLGFVNAFLGTTYPDALKEAALFNLSTLRSQTVFRTEDGRMFGWEGVMDEAGSCYGSCTHVWNYEQATAYLFGDLARSMREVEFAFATDDAGAMSFRVGLPLDPRARAVDKTAADGQMGCIVKFYRDWQLSGDRAFLDTHWLRVKAALAYAWRPGGWDADQDGVMEGSQHNTMDVDYLGPNPQMGFWYLAALEAGARLAEAKGDAAFAAKCRDLRQRGAAWMDAKLFNGEYYEHIVTDPKTHAFVDWSQRPASDIPRFQLGRGCLVDQLVGQMLGHSVGFGHLAKPDNIRTTLRSILRYNWRDSFADEFNNMRSYVFADEAGLIMASWPRGRFEVPFPYFAEVMTGFEYTAAVNLIQEGMPAEAIKVISAIRARHDGGKRNPFSEAECGHHYARAMASWNAHLAWSGFLYSAVTREITFTAKPGRFFWSTGSAWGTSEVHADHRVTLTTLGGELSASRLVLTGHGATAIAGEKLSADQTIVLNVPASPPP
jgi:non-lysosomal glucosylceramidase